MTKLRLCPSGKYAYVRAENAHERLHKIRTTGDHKRNPPRSVYHCGECGFYHLTSWTPQQVARLVEEGRWDHRNAMA